VVGVNGPGTGRHHCADSQQQAERLLRLADADRPGRISCSLPNAMNEPQNDTEPMIAANNEATTMRGRRLAVLERRKTLGVKEFR
jgi:hypothetical protein